MHVPKNLLYTKHHTWVKVINENLAVIGITEELHDIMESIDYIDMPHINDELEMELKCGTTLHYQKGQMYDVISPLTGRVTKLNYKLKKNPHLLYSSCYKEGWLFEMQFDEVDELEMLNKAEEYIEFCETHGLHQ